MGRGGPGGQAQEPGKNAFGLMMSLNMLIETAGGFGYTSADCAVDEGGGLHLHSHATVGGARLNGGGKHVGPRGPLSVQEAPGGSEHVAQLYGRGG